MEGCCCAFNQDFSETINYNNPLYPACVSYGILSAYPDYSGVSHWHEELEFIVVKKGKMTYNVNGKLTELNEGCGIMVNSRQLHYGFSMEHNECEFICILLSPGILGGNRWFYQNLIERVTANCLYPYLYLGNNGWQASVLERLNKMYDYLYRRTFYGACYSGRHSGSRRLLQKPALPAFQEISQGYTDYLYYKTTSAEKSFRFIGHGGRHYGYCI